MHPWISKRLRLPTIIEAHSRPGASQAPGNDTTWELHLGGVVVGWALRNGGGGVA